METGIQLTYEETEIFGKTCAVVLKVAGPRAMLSCLKEFLSPFYGITRIFLGIRYQAEGLFLPVADTLPGNLLLHNVSGRSLSTEQIRKLMIDDSAPYFFNEDPFPDAKHGHMRHEDFLSHLRIPLFSMGSARMHAGFCSGIPGVFGDADARKLLHLLSPVSEELRQIFRNHTFAGSAHDFNMDSYTMLKKCPEMAEVLADIEKVAPLETSVLIRGETGVGKDVVADTIHQLSSRRNKPIIKVNCSAISETLMESELFGHEKGAFTGAEKLRRGYFESASGGTIFLDEIGELSPRMQSELLRVLDNREIFRVGGTKSISLDIRVVAATNRNLEKMVREGTFRRDLLYRLNVFPIDVPALRTRRMDIPVLASLFVAQLASRLGICTIPTIPNDEMEKLCRYAWPGNVRELRNRIEREIIRSMNGTTCRPLHFVLPEDHGTPEMSGRSAISMDMEHPPTLEEFGDFYVSWMLDRTKGKITGKDGAAVRLGIHPNTVRDRLKRHNAK